MVDRVGGDEFVGLLPDIEDLEAVVTAARSRPCDGPALLLLLLVAAIAGAIGQAIAGSSRGGGHRP